MWTHQIVKQQTRFRTEKTCETVLLSTGTALAEAPLQHRTSGTLEEPDDVHRTTGIIEDLDVLLNSIDSAADAIRVVIDMGAEGHKDQIAKLFDTAHRSMQDIETDLNMLPVSSRMSRLYRVELFRECIKVLSEVEWSSENLRYQPATPRRCDAVELRRNQEFTEEWLRSRKRPRLITEESIEATADVDCHFADTQAGGSSPKATPSSRTSVDHGTPVVPSSAAGEEPNRLVVLLDAD